MTLTKAELSLRLSESIGLSKRESTDLVEAFFREIALALESGDEVKLSGFGVFHLRDKPARPGRNPKTGEPSIVSARRVVSFQSSQKLRETVDWAHERIAQQADVA